MKRIFFVIINLTKINCYFDDHVFGINHLNSNNNFISIKKLYNKDPFLNHFQINPFLKYDLYLKEKGFSDLAKRQAFLMYSTMLFPMFSHIFEKAETKRHFINYFKIFNSKIKTKDLIAIIKFFLSR